MYLVTTLFRKCQGVGGETLARASEGADGNLVQVRGDEGEASEPKESAGRHSRLTALWCQVARKVALTSRRWLVRESLRLSVDA